MLTPGTGLTIFDSNYMQLHTDCVNLLAYKLIHNRSKGNQCVAWIVYMFMTTPTYFYNFIHIYTIFIVYREEIFEWMIEIINR
jgi:hypothetical protein